MKFDFKFYLIIFLGLFQLFLLGNWMYSNLDEKLNQPFLAGSQKEVVFEVYTGDNSHKIAKNLRKQNLISNEFLFDYYIKKINKENSLQAGKYLFSQNMSVKEMADKIVFGDVKINKVRLFVAEGFTLNDISKELGELKIFGEKEFLDFKVKDFKEDYDFLSDVDGKETLEGFLFPDTYEYDKDTVTVEYVIKSMLDNFNNKLTKELKKEIKRQKKSIFEIVTMASILEKEVRTSEDMNTASGILWKRIDAGMPLQVDATTIYTTKNNDITSKDLKIDTPYNTYIYGGLPKGPISNPGIRAIKAAIYPKSSEYWFYISKPTGETVFSKTFKEHRQAINKYLR